MDRLKFLAILLFFVLSINGQKKIKIDFNPKSSGDYEIYLKTAFDRIGYETYINYHDRFDKSIKYDYILNYKDSAWFYGDDLKKIELNLFNLKGDLIKSVSVKTSYVNLGINPIKVVFKGVRELTGIKVPYDKKEDEVKKMGTKNWNVNYYVEKLDSAIYVVKAKGAATRTKEQMRKAFLTKADLIMDNYSYYMQLEDYYYNTSGPVNINVNMAFVHKANMVTGIIIGAEEKKELSEPPQLYIELIKQTKPNNLE